MNRRGTTKLVAATALGVAALAVGSSWAAEETKGATEEFTALAMNTQAGPGPQATRMTIRIKRWSSDEERGAFLKTLAEKGAEALVGALQDAEPVGNMSFTGTLGYDLRYARDVRDGDTRHVILATDRPVLFQEAMRNTRSMDKRVTILHLELGPEGKDGTGQLLIGAEVALDVKTKELTIESLGTQPIKLTQIEAKKK